VRQGQIFGGNPTGLEEAPYQVSLHYNGNIVCEGSIITPLLILTAAK